MLHHRPDIRHDVELDAGCAQRHHDVGEQDRGVHPVPADRLQRDLGDQVGVEARSHQGVLGSQRPVLGQGPAGLPHEPHRHAAGLAAGGCGQIGRLGQLAAGVHRFQCCHAPVAHQIGAPCAQACQHRLASNAMTTAEPAQFREAVAAMNATTVRPEIELGPIRPPQRLAPFSYALGAEVRHPDAPVVPERSEGDAFGRLILLHDPEGAEAWDGTMRLVAYIQADLDSTEAVDPLLPEVAWSWLVEALESRAEHVTALGGTVTATTSVRYGDISGPPRAHQLELRASWTATTLDLGPHVQAFCEVLEHAAGLPPSGVTDLSSRTRA